MLETREARPWIKFTHKNKRPRIIKMTYRSHINHTYLRTLTATKHQNKNHRPSNSQSLLTTRGKGPYVTNWNFPHRTLIEHRYYREPGKERKTRKPNQKSNPLSSGQTNHTSDMMVKVSSRRKKWRSRKWCSPLSWHSRWYGSHYFVSSYWRELPSGLSRGTLWCWCHMVLISVAWLTLCYMPWWTGLTERNLSLSCGILYFTSATVLSVASVACNLSNTTRRVSKIS